MFYFYIASHTHRLADMHKRLTAKEADAAKEQCNHFLSNDVLSHVNDFKNFDMKENRLDEFLGTYIIGKKCYDDLWKSVNLYLRYLMGKV